MAAGETCLRPGIYLQEWRTGADTQPKHCDISSVVNSAGRRRPSSSSVITCCGGCCVRVLPPCTSTVSFIHKFLHHIVYLVIETLFSPR
jgi:hypothetical protein